MSRFNTRTARPAATSPISTTGAHTATHEGGAGHLRDAKSSCSCSRSPTWSARTPSTRPASERDARFAAWSAELAVEDPAWTAGLPVAARRREHAHRADRRCGRGRQGPARTPGAGTDGPVEPRRSSTRCCSAPTSRASCSAYWTPATAGRAQAAQARHRRRGRRLYTDAAAEVRHRLQGLPLRRRARPGPPAPDPRSRGRAPVPARPRPPARPRQAGPGGAADAPRAPRAAGAAGGRAARRGHCVGRGRADGGRA